MAKQYSEIDTALAEFMTCSGYFADPRYHAATR
jgi:hypothetical protein